MLVMSGGEGYIDFRIGKYRGSHRPALHVIVCLAVLSGVWRPRHSVSLPPNP